MSPDGSYGGRKGFLDVLTAAIADFTRYGFDSVERLTYWQNRLMQAMDLSLGDPARRAEMLRSALSVIYDRAVERGGILKHHPGVSRFTLQRIKPKLRSELDRRILASAELIRLNRQEAIRDTLQRFSGWATSVPNGGSETVGRRDVKDGVKKSLYSLPFRERRVIIDQSHKLVSSIDAVIAKSEGALAARWHSNFRQPGYDARIEHKHFDIDGDVFLMRESWAKDAGLIKAGDAGYSDQIPQPAELPFCRCRFVYLYSLRQLPQEMLTEKGRTELARVRSAA